jgi:hypothetical protein
MPFFRQRHVSGSPVVKLPKNLFDFDTPKHTTHTTNDAVKSEATKMLAMTPEQRKAHLTANPKIGDGPDARLEEMNRRTLF